MKLTRLAVAALAAASSLALLPAAARADVQTIDFESAPPALGSAVERVGDVTFPSGRGFRPYRTGVGARAHSGTTVGDLGRCAEEVEATGGNPGDCEFFQARTTGVLARTANAVTLFAGSFTAAGPFDPPVQATLTAFGTNGAELASTGPVRIDASGFDTRLSVSSGAGRIAGFTVRASSGLNGANELHGDLGIDDVTVEFAGGAPADFAVTTTEQILSLVQGQTVDVPVRIDRFNGSSGPVVVSASGLPSGVSAAPVTVPGTGTTATLALVTAPNAPATGFVPTEATITAVADGPSAGRLPRTAPLRVRVAPDFELSAHGFSEADLRHGTLDTLLPHCAPVDVPVKVRRDIAMNRDITLSLRQVGEGPLPPGLSAEILPSPVVPPGGGLVAERTLRLRADHTVDLGTVDLLLQGVVAGSSPDPERGLPLVIGRESPIATVASSTPGSGLARTPRFGGTGTTVRVRGNGFCPGTTVAIGSSFAVVPTRLLDDRTIEFDVPRNALTRTPLIEPPGRMAPYRTEDVLTVDNFRNVNGFQFRNYPFGSLSLDELTRAFGADDLFVKVNPCWPFGNCTVVTGILNPIAAIEWGVINAVAPLVNSFGNSGHCFGMALAMHRFHSGKESVREFKLPGTSRPPRHAFELGTPSEAGEALSSFLDAEQIKAFSSEVLDAFFHRPIPMDEHLKTIEEEFRRKRPVLIQVSATTPKVAHVVVAYDLEQKGNTAVLHIYDPNDPFDEDEARGGSVHAKALDKAVIEIDKRKEEWKMRWNDGFRVGGGESLWAMPASALPDDASLPGLGTIKSALGWLFFGPGDGAVRTVAEGTYMPLPGAAPGAEGGAGEAASAGTWIAESPGRPLEVTFIGTEPGTYTQSYAASGFVAAAEVTTATGVRDKLTGGAGSVSLRSGMDRPLGIDLATRSGGINTAATIDTHASAGDVDRAGFAPDDALTYAHRGAPTRVEFTLTTVRRNGGPATFASGPIAIASGDRLRAEPLDSGLRRVRVTIRDARGQKRARVLRTQGAPGGRLRIGAAKLKGHRLKLPVRLSGFRGRAILGASLRLVRDGDVLARRSLALKRGGERRTISWRLPRSLAEGRYRLRVDARALTSPGRGVTTATSVAASRTGWVRVGR